MIGVWLDVLMGVFSQGGEPQPTVLVAQRFRSNPSVAPCTRAAF